VKVRSRLRMNGIEKVQNGYPEWVIDLQHIPE
jgi:hypothetical protein